VPKSKVYPTIALAMYRSGPVDDASIDLSFMLALI
jgi:hypothetical protein